MVPGGFWFSCGFEMVLDGSCVDFSVRRLLVFLGLGVSGGGFKLFLDSSRCFQG